MSEENLESSYYEDRAFDPEHLLDVRSHYLKFLDGADLVIEVGCGRGEFLEVIAGRAKRVIGVDLESSMVEKVKARGLEAIHADAVSFLESTDERPDAILAAHLLEHLEVEASLRLIRAAAKVLSPGGVLVVAAPNPASLSIMLSDFWSDPTHVRPYSLTLIEFLLKEGGFEILESGENPRDNVGPPPNLLLPETMEPWGEVEVPQGTEGASRFSAEMKRLRADVTVLSRAFQVLASRIDALRHQTHVIRGGVDSVLRHLYGPNEIFAVGKLPE